MKYYFATSVLLLFLFGNIIPARAQYGYSEFVETLITGITDSSLALVDRQLSGDTSVYIGGVLDSIKSRHSDYPGNAKAAQLILEKFESFGLEADYQQYDGNGFNVIGTKTGTVFPNEHYIVCAHYDAQPGGPIAPGADDNASGTSAVIEAARLLSPYDFDYTVKFIAFDEEEQGLIGSRAYADTAYKYGVIIKGVVNLDMIGWDSNNDFELSVSSNVQSMPLLADFTDILRIFQPQLSPHLITAPNSDHSSFWNKGYPALLAIEEYPGDFLPYYHTVNDLFQYLNPAFFVAMTRGAVASVATMARNYKMNMSHQPFANSRNNNDRIANLVLSGPHMIDTGIYSPRLYYKIDDVGLNFLNAYQISGDTFKFSIPGQQAGSKVSYYFAAQDADGEYVVTLPEGGKGINPPGSVSPPVFYSYYIMNDTVATVCASGLPMSIPGYQTVNKVVNIPYSGQLLDVNVSISLNHYLDKDINLYLVSPSGREVMLSTKNGTGMDHYTNTVFDDEAVTFINQGMPPFTGTFRPEQPLSAFDDTAASGNWSLKIRNAGSIPGTLTNFCLTLTLSSSSNLYVDASRPFSGDGRSWHSAYRTISEVTELEPPAGSLILIKPGTYQEDLIITSNGQEIVPLKTGISLSNGHKIQFPAGTDLSGIDLAGNPGEYYACVFRSKYFNSGYYQVNQVDESNDYIMVNGHRFNDEEGVVGDSALLSAVVCRPVIYSKYSADPETERVVVDAAGDESISTVLYLGDAIGDGAYDALPANYNIIDGIDLTGSDNGGGIHIQSSSFNIITNSRIYELNGAGILVNGNADHPAYFNLIINNEIFNTPTEGIYIGAAEMTAYNNHTHFTHLIGNDIHTSGSGPYAMLENAIDITDANRSSLIESNVIHDFNLVSSGNGALNIGSGTNRTLINGNIFHQIDKTGDGPRAIIMVHDQSINLDILNNILYDTLASDNDIYAFRVDGTGHTSSRAVHNTINNIDGGFLLEDYGSAPGFVISNNIIRINDQYYTHLGAEGRFQVSNNLYPTDPTPDPSMPYFEEIGRIVGNVDFMDPPGGDFNLLIKSDNAICTGMGLSSPVLYDASRNSRDPEMPDIGAMELENKIVWTGLIDQNWTNPGNWSTNDIPDSFSNVVIKDALHNPVINIDNYVINGMLLKSGSFLSIIQNSILEQRSERRPILE